MHYETGYYKDYGKRNQHHRTEHLNEYCGDSRAVQRNGSFGTECHTEHFEN